MSAPPSGSWSSPSRRARPRRSTSNRSSSRWSRTSPAEPGPEPGPTEWATADATAGVGVGVGVGPHPEPWPDDDRFDPALLAAGDRRNVADRYRYWRLDAIVTDLDRRRHRFHVAIENWQHDANIGSIVRTANAFGAAEVHIVGRRRWNRRGAMVTDRYQHIRHHRDIDELVRWSADQGLPIIGIDTGPGADPLEPADLPERTVLLFGQEGPGLSAEARNRVDRILSIAQFGSTRSINAAVAAGIAMHAWVRLHATSPPSEEGPVPGPDPAR